MLEAAGFVSVSTTGCWKLWGGGSRIVVARTVSGDFVHANQAAPRKLFRKVSALGGVEACGSSYIPPSEALR